MEQEERDVSLGEVVGAINRWVDEHGTGWEVLDVVDGGDRVAVRLERAGRRAALFLTPDEGGRLVAATVTRSVG